ncbi:FG-GAP-like repeat-containing protein [uncultured Algibacter sp.]|uniref:FG-GAP-like repeat-containing protein n=1 Tax=uncultured Algibacter sp. TaxID=298659 RepID=UPI002636CC8C|nr:FG-GAP-like repeat-containing protein [uncultured Algibacter sp.]
MKQLKSYYRIMFFVSITVMFLGCQSEQKQSKGERLAKNMCSSCHLFTEPALLTKEVWDANTLPEMGLRLGMSKHGKRLYAKTKEGVYFPKQPLLSQEDWDAIVAYYIESAPDSIVTKKQHIANTSNLFKCQTFSYGFQPSTIITMAAFNSYDKSLYLGDGRLSSLFVVDMDGKIIKKEKLDSPPVKITFQDSVKSVLTIGSLYPSNRPLGILKLGDKKIDSLTRPVDFLVKDINSDGFEDVLISEFGNNIGSLVWYENLKDKNYKRHTILNLPGSIKMDYADINQDNVEDLLVLVSQESETLYALNFHDGEFQQTNLIQHQPAFGSNDFQVTDIDMDGDKDIILSNGDNADYSTILKDFHGVRIFVNDGKGEFSETYFYPFHGASKVVVDDFNLDGKKDMLAIANFGDFNDENYTSVVLLLNQGGLNFKPYAIPDVPKYRWQTMDLADIDDDGDKDILIGAFNINIGPEESVLKKVPKVSWIKLENTVY